RPPAERWLHWRWLRAMLPVLSVQLESAGWTAVETPVLERLQRTARGCGGPRRPAGQTRWFVRRIGGALWHLRGRISTKLSPVPAGWHPAGRRLRRMLHAP